jgi:regulator of sigma E protease
MNISFLSTLIQFVIIFGLLLFFHEFGHFLTARLLKIDVEEFGFGFPPRIVRLFTLGGTEFTLNWIPFGAFVRVKGENDPDVPGGMASASPWKRLAVLLGGPVMNILVGIIVFSVMFMRIGAPQTNVVQVVDVSPNTPAAAAGFKAGDTIIKVDGQAINSMQSLQDLIQQNLGKPTTIELKRDGTTQTVSVTPRTNPPKDQGPLGITLGNPYNPISLGQALPTAAYAAYDQVHQLVMLPVQMIRGTVPSDQTRVVGPVGMFDIYRAATTQDAQAGSSQFPDMALLNAMWFVGTISVALGLTNLLPIPALDGGRIIFVLPELLLRRRIPAQYENLIHMIGFAALLLFISYITLQDVIHPVVLP